MLKRSMSGQNWTSLSTHWRTCRNMAICINGAADGGRVKPICLLAVAVAVMLLSVPAAIAGKVMPISAEGLQAVLHESDGNRVVVFMAAWCAPCVEELPIINRLAADYAPHGLKVIGVALDSGGPEAMQPIVDRHQIRFPIYWAGETAIQTCRISRLPLMLLIRDGEEVKRIAGGRSQEAIEADFRSFME